MTKILDAKIIHTQPINLKSSVHQHNLRKLDTMLQATQRQKQVEQRDRARVYCCHNYCYMTKKTTSPPPSLRIQAVMAPAACLVMQFCRLSLFAPTILSTSLPSFRNTKVGIASTLNSSATACRQKDHGFSVGNRTATTPVILQKKNKDYEFDFCQHNLNRIYSIRE